MLTRALLRRGEFICRADLIEKITSFTIRYNRTARPWKWAYDARADTPASVPATQQQPPPGRLPLQPCRTPRNSK